MEYLSSAQRRAIARQCPECGRKSAMTDDSDYSIKWGERYCRWCHYHETWETGQRNSTLTKHPSSECICDRHLAERRGATS